MNDWIPISQQAHPTHNRTVLVTIHGDIVRTARHNGRKWDWGSPHNNYLTDKDVLAWQEYPAPYTEVERVGNFVIGTALVPDGALVGQNTKYVTPKL